MENIDTLQLADLERDLLAMMIIKQGACIPKVANILSPDDFNFPVYKFIYKGILRLFHNHITPSMLTLLDELKKMDGFNDTIFHYTADLHTRAFTDAYALDYAKSIKDKSIRRQIIKLSDDLVNNANNPKVELSSLFSNADKALHNLNSSSSPPPLIDQFHYFSNIISSDIQLNKSFANRCTGFSNIDQHQIFSPGLYVIGATPACGKTTFAWQLLNQLAANGEHCIFCSYEMSRLELYTKTLARELFLRDPDNAFPAADIRRGASNDSLDELLISLSSNKDFPKVNLLELRDESVDDLLNILSSLCSSSYKPPVVCVDYLQIIPPSLDQRLTSDKAKIDDIVRKLKSFQRETNTTFIVVSSFNRLNYYQQVSFESFKESGNIEYTADVVWALQLNVANSIKGGTLLSDVRQKFDDAKKLQPRQLQLKCLKNRQGNNYDAFFFYHSKFDYFEPCSFSDFAHPPAQVDDNTDDDKD